MIQSRETDILHLFRIKSSAQSFRRRKTTNTSGLLTVTATQPNCKRRSREHKVVIKDAAKGILGRGKITMQKRTKAVAQWQIRTIPRAKNRKDAFASFIYRYG
ncbi:hypothetical protein M9H77_26507 [Catharanthus roseus]|uniref:Uncharacterized protein n=1 Tax=Catharanthus roseus TaxID=4058 RepID=A0ACC0AA80_CATRO|nr:hypothetical protein M9H77_26507 [Catharanthus roseus]